jgi:hypothetical protein
LKQYSTDIIEYAGVKRSDALLFTMGFGLINFLFALPATTIIDAVSGGRRKLLLATFPLMSAFMLLTSMAHYFEDKAIRTPVVMLGMYLFAIAYSPGEGPVPFTYSAEWSSPFPISSRNHNNVCISYPLYVRDIGMSIATGSCYIPPFLLSFFPSFLQQLTKTVGPN